jgi:hypothetical protein
MTLSRCSDRESGRTPRSTNHPRPPARPAKIAMQRRCVNRDRIVRALEKLTDAGLFSAVALLDGF